MKSCAVSNYLQRDGFVMISNLLISYKEELGLTNKEVMFIISVMRHKENYKLHDEELDPTVSSRTLQRRRKSLKEKGLLNFSIWRSSNEQGQFMTEGITYDFTPLEEKLQELSNKIAQEKEEKIKEEAKNYIIEYEDDSPIVEFAEDWKNHYGDVYKLSAAEKDWYNGLGENQKYIGIIFDYCGENKLFGSITPRLALFMKNNIRWTQLKDYCDEISASEERIFSAIDEDYEELSVLERIERNNQKLK